jgi:hypothetical protein
LTLFQKIDAMCPRPSKLGLHVTKMRKRLNTLISHIAHSSKKKIPSCENNKPHECQPLR